MQQAGGGHQGSGGTGRGGSGGGGDLFDQLFGPGAATGTLGGKRVPARGGGGHGGTAPSVSARLAAAGFVVGAGGWGLDEVRDQLPTTASWADVQAELDVALPWAYPVAGVLLGCSACASYARRRIRQRTDTSTADKSATVTAEQRAAAGAVKANPRDVVRVRTVYSRDRWLRRRVRRVEVDYAGGLLRDDPGIALAEAMSALLGVSLRPDSWDATSGRAVLVPGVIVRPEPEPHEAEIDIVARARQVLERPLGADVRATVDACSDDGAATEFTIVHPKVKGLVRPQAQQGMQEYLAGTLPAAPGGRGWGVDVDPRGDRIRVRALKPLPTYELHPVLDYASLATGPNQLLLPFGTGEDDDKAVWDISASTDGPHMLVVGPSGTGKTATMRSVVVSATRQRLEVWGLDPKMIELMSLEGWPGVTRLGFVVEDLVGLIEATHAEMWDRYHRIARRQVLRDQLPPLIVVIDEYFILRAEINRWWGMLSREQKQEWGSTSSKCPILSKIDQMLALARSARVHLLIGVQRPDATLFDEGSRDNLGTRVSMGKLSPEGAGMMWDDRSVGILPPATKGRAWATARQGHPAEYQCWWTPDLDPHEANRAKLAAEERDRVDELRPDPFEPQSVTASGLIVPVPVQRDRPAGGVEEEIADVTDIVRARDLAEDNTVKLERDGEMVYATIEQVDHDDDSGIVVLDVLWDGGGAEQLEVDDGEEIWLLSGS